MRIRPETTESRGTGFYFSKAWRNRRRDLNLIAIAFVLDEVEDVEGL